MGVGVVWWSWSGGGCLGAEFVDKPLVQKIAQNYLWHANRKSLEKSWLTLGF